MTMIKALLSVLSLAALTGSGAAWAGPAVVDEGAGTLNPQELAIEFWVGKSREDRFDPQMCAYGVFMDKTGSHEDARRVFERCAAAGNQYSMPWMSYLEENGYDRPSDPVAAADWDKKLADTGSSLGQFNYGLDILRGHGVTQDARSENPISTGRLRVAMRPRANSPHMTTIPNR